MVKKETGKLSKNQHLWKKLSGICSLEAMVAVGGEWCAREKNCIRGISGNKWYGTGGVFWKSAQWRRELEIFISSWMLCKRNILVLAGSIPTEFLPSTIYRDIMKRLQKRLPIL